MQSNLSQQFDNRTQLLIAIFGLLIAFPLLEIPFLGISITFPLFIWICLRVHSRYGHQRRLFALSGRLDVLMLLFMLMAMLSIFLAPPADRGGIDLVVRDGKSILYLTYWFCVYLFFRRWFAHINLLKLGLYSLYGVLLTTLISVVGTKGGAFFKLGPFLLAQNSYAFNVVACIGLGAIYLLNRFGWKMILAYAAIMAYPMLLSESRTGSIIMLLQCIAISIVAFLQHNKQLRKLLFIGAFATLAFLVFLDNSTNLKVELSVAIGDAVEPYNPELAVLLKDRENTLKKDKPWLIRKTQVEKGVNLFLDYPVFGVGWGHFRYVRGDINLSEYVYLNRAYDDYALTRSSHNSYIQVLAETGLMGFLPLILIKIYILWNSVNLFLRSNSIKVAIPLAVSLIGIAIYFWTVSAITGAVWYFIVGLFGGAVASERRRNK